MERTYNIRKQQTQFYCFFRGYIIKTVFQALLSTYLLEDVDMLSKHCLVLYVLLDLVSVDSTDNSEQVIQGSHRLEKFLNIQDSLEKSLDRERSGSVVECLTRDRRAAGSSLTGVTALWSLSKTHLS